MKKRFQTTIKDRFKMAFQMGYFFVGIVMLVLVMPRNIQGRLLCSKESISPYSRVNCGSPGITESECYKKGCCFDSSVRHVPHCFVGIDSCSSEMIAKVQRASCGGKGITKQQCEAKKCCYHGSQCFQDSAEIECYNCKNADGNCNSGNLTCSSMSVNMDRCMKKVTGDAVFKSCSTSEHCSYEKAVCKSTEKCEVHCCDSDLCNEGLLLKPVTFLTLLAMALGVAKYLM